MPTYSTVLHKRGTRTQLDAAATAGNLHAGEIYLITDEDRLAIGLSTTTYQTYAKVSELSEGAESAGIAAKYIFCDDVIFAGTTPAWHELEKQSDGGVSGSHTATGTAYSEMDRYVTPALNTTVIPEGIWQFQLFAKVSAASGQLRATIYQVNASGAIVGSALGVAESAAFTSTTVTSIMAYIFIARQTGWAITDRIGVVIAGKRIGGAATLTFYHDRALGYVSVMDSPLQLLHNQLDGLNDGQYQHLTVAEKSQALSGAVDWANPITISNTATNLTAQKHHYIAETAANRVMTLPAVANSAGKLVSVQISLTTTYLVTIQANAAELIDGVNTRILWAGESAILFCNGTNWTKIGGKSIPLAATIQRTGDQTIGNNSETIIQYNTLGNQSMSALTDVATLYRIYIVRSNLIQIMLSTYYEGRSNNSMTNISMVSRIYCNTTQIGGIDASGFSWANSAANAFCGMIYNATVGDYIQGRTQHWAGANRALGPYVALNALSFTEIPKW